MTLTDQLPSLRRTLPDPLAIDAWPEETRARVDDVLVGGLSLRAVAAVTGTPCVHAGAAVLPGTGGVPCADATTAVVVTMVVASVPHGTGTGVVLDVDPGTTGLVWHEARLLGRASTARRIPQPIVRDSRVLAVPRLAADLHPGDLLAIPCAGRVHVRHGVLERADREREAWLTALR